MERDRHSLPCSGTDSNGVGFEEHNDTAVSRLHDVFSWGVARSMGSRNEADQTTETTSYGGGLDERMRRSVTWDLPCP
ncbi:hypothetical protein Cob_v003539 [Colletotrichum orbiculare MAFF 240422]|uniref:Uncharacterized protein n=1 Tax=Colletotrichum orbiculare (strain 104-T / ATCC 96160 / CBS 514.97 / LARS 414 / MAFF 240422) TaxID=1213857 RepID=A0A484G0H5_COLOR|nr:hypothetical protein Cob_v003539 [Colletotrichum orbiculare MAFF 240422]